MKKLLIVVDMQNDFITGSLGTEEARKIVPKVGEKIKTYQREGGEVVYTMDTHTSDYLNTQEGKFLPVEHCIKGTDGWELEPSLKDETGLKFEKQTFGSRELADYLAVNAYDSIELVGLCTDICVISNALLTKSVQPEVPIYVDASCCAGVTPESHKQSLEAMKMCQIIVQSEEA